MIENSKRGENPIKHNQIMWSLASQIMSTLPNAEYFDASLQGKSASKVINALYDQVGQTDEEESIVSAGLNEFYRHCQELYAYKHPINPIRRSPSPSNASHIVSNVIESIAVINSGNLLESYSKQLHAAGMEHSQLASIRLFATGKRALSFSDEYPAASCHLIVTDNGLAVVSHKLMGYDREGDKTALVRKPEGELFLFGDAMGVAGQQYLNGLKVIHDNAPPAQAYYPGEWR